MIVLTLDKFIRSHIISYIEFFLLCFTSYISLVNPIGVLPTFLLLTENHSKEEQKSVVKKASTVLFVGILIFAFLGHYIFMVFGVSIDALRIVGGVLLIEMGNDLLKGNPPKMKSPNEIKGTHIGVVPLGFPVLLGAGAITLSMVRKSQATTPEMIFGFILSAFIVSLINFFVLYHASSIVKHIGKNGQSIINRFMGLITMLIAVEFFFKGLHPFFVSIGKEIMKTI